MVLEWLTDQKQVAYNPSRRSYRGISPHSKLAYNLDNPYKYHRRTFCRISRTISGMVLEWFWNGFGMPPIYFN